MYNAVILKILNSVEMITGYLHNNQQANGPA